MPDLLQPCESRPCSNLEDKRLPRPQSLLAHEDYRDARDDEKETEQPCSQGLFPGFGAPQSQRKGPGNEVGDREERDV